MKKPVNSLFKKVGYPLWLAALIVLLSFGCAKKEVLRVPLREPLPSVITSGDLLKRIDFSHIRTVKASVKVRLIYKGEFMGTYSGVFLFDNPGRLNLRFSGPFGITTMQSLFDSGTLQILFPSEDVLYEGRLTFRHLLPDIRYLQDGKISLNETEGLYGLHIPGNDGSSNPSVRESYYFEMESLRLKRIDMFSEERREITINVKETDNGFPTEMEAVAGEVIIQLRLKDMLINEEIPEEAFRPLSAQRQLPLSWFFRKD